MPHSNVNKRFSRYPNKEASRSLYTKRFLSRRTSSRHCCPSSTPTSSSPFYREDLRIDSPLRARSWSRETSRRRYRIRGMQVRKMCRERERKRKREMCGFSPTFQAEIPSCHEKADPRRCSSSSHSIGILRNPSEALSRPGSWALVSHRKPIEPSFEQLASRKIWMRVGIVSQYLAYLRFQSFGWKLERMCTV